MPIYTPQNSLGSTSTEVYPHHSSDYNNAPTAGCGSDINTTTSFSGNSQLAASTIQ